MNQKITWYTGWLQCKMCQRVTGQYKSVTHVTHPNLWPFWPMTHDPLTHCQLCYDAPATVVRLPFDSRRNSVGTGSPGQRFWPGRGLVGVGSGHGSMWQTRVFWQRKHSLVAQHTVVKIISQFKAQILADRVRSPSRKRPSRVGSRVKGSDPVTSVARSRSNCSPVAVVTTA